MFAPLSKKLADLGYGVFRFDFRGHGESGGRSVEMTIEGELADLEAAVREVKRKGFKKIGLLGASFGGGTATIFAALKRKELQFLCLWYPVLNYDHTFINPYLPWLKNQMARMRRDLEEKGWTTIPNDGKPFRIGKKLFDEMNWYFPYKELAKIRLPVVIIHGDNDSYVPYKDSLEYIKNKPGEAKLITIKGADHGFGGENEKLYKEEAINKTVLTFRRYL
ncbi:hypothetical protein A2W14_05145 [Candidatus Gottesmanbacteria bacterium RBG_16_37_8]|uniref:Serine aminopeptidase S33 domain-containing protein n=1 Tax=Candidatus Gottesmanbacteria bacterium RBG_16_37_8 TaxID=1798371 RepID=A0A1F5YRD1_9BACT|nr:MAG: hypothetical protein A2W14_05145 [Candidatus Gottesmanbacteria bacterium RBG_16_37_8]